MDSCCLGKKSVYNHTRVSYHPATRVWLYPKTGILDTATLTYKAIQPHTHEYSWVLCIQIFEEK